jgi:hypothetical protein
MRDFLQYVQAALARLRCLAFMVDSMRLKMGTSFAGNVRLGNTEPKALIKPQIPTGRILTRVCGEAGDFDYFRVVRKKGNMLPDFGKLISETCDTVSRHNQTEICIDSTEGRD